MSELTDHLRRMALDGTVGSMVEWDKFVHLTTGMEKRIAELEEVAEAAGAMARNGVCSGYTDFYDALRAAGYLKE